MPVKPGCSAGWWKACRGGKFGHGFIAAGVSAALPGRINGNRAFAGVFKVVVGGTVSKITGGKFANGAAYAAFAAVIGSIAENTGSPFKTDENGERYFLDSDGNRVYPDKYFDKNGHPILAEVNYADLALDMASFGVGIIEGAGGIFMMMNPLTFVPGVVVVAHSSLGLANTVLSMKGNLYGTKYPGVLAATGDALFGQEGARWGGFLDHGANLSGALRGAAKFGSDTVSTIQELRSFREDSGRDE